MMRLISLIFLIPSSAGFVAPSSAGRLRNPVWSSTSPSFSSSLRLPMAPAPDLEDEIEYNARRKAQAGGGGGGAGEVAAGAILGGLMLGPFGALFGAQMGAQMGAKNAVNRARAEEMERLGISQDMLDAAKEIGFALEQSLEGLRASQESLETQRRFARRLDQAMNGLYERAKQKLSEGKDDEARMFLLEKKDVSDKLKTTLKACADEKKRSEQLQSNVAALEERALEVESLLRRTVGAKTLQNTAMSQPLSLAEEDPLLRKFKDMGID